MDILRKMFTKPRDGGKDDTDMTSTERDEFRKPAWYEETESDDELFDGDREFLFQIFTNPIELQKHFDRQMQQVIKSMKQLEENDDLFEPPSKEEYLKPGFEDHFFEEFKKKGLDTDLDGEICPDQLHYLLQHVTPELEHIAPKKGNITYLPEAQPQKKLSDLETILGKIHGTIFDEESKPVVRRRPVQPPHPRMPHHFGGVFEGTYQGPKMFGQSIINQTIRKPDGTYETKQIVRDSTGHVKTTITRTREGKTETVTTYGDENQPKMRKAVDGDDAGGSLVSDRNIFVSPKGYALPKNIW